MTGGLESKVKKPGFFKKVALVAGASILSILSTGCSQIQHRARVQTKPPEEVGFVSFLQIFKSGLFPINTINF